jgi:hypothetical protein
MEYICRMCESYGNRERAEWHVTAEEGRVVDLCTAHAYAAMVGGLRVWNHDTMVWESLTAQSLERIKGDITQ